MYLHATPVKNGHLSIGLAGVPGDGTGNFRICSAWTGSSVPSLMHILRHVCVYFCISLLHFLPDISLFNISICGKKENT